MVAAKLEPDNAKLNDADKSEFEGDYLLDDRCPELENILQGRKSVPVCFDQPWNQDWKGLRVHNYQEFLNIVRNHHSI